MASGSSIKHRVATIPSSAERSDVITSRDNKWLKQFRSALRGTGPSGRAGNELIAVEGPKLVEEAIRSGLEAEAMLVSVSGEHHLRQILTTASSSDFGIRRERIFKTSDQLFAGCAGTETPQGVAALFRQPEWTLENLLRGRPRDDGSFSKNAPLILVMAGVQDPGNVGTILRSAEAFGATGAIAAPGTADPWSPKAIRASAGSAFRLPLLRELAIPAVLAQLKTQRVQIVATSMRASANGEPQLASAETLRKPSAIFIGSEGSGLPQEILHAADATLSIPMSGSVESLNAAIAASLLLYEASRQRKAKESA
jgi:TrmH family RNA methyltransferase